MKDSGERASKGDRPNVVGDDISTLKDLGISRDESSKCQRLAAIPEADLEATIAEAMDNHVTTTTAEVLRACALRDQWKSGLMQKLDSIEAKEAKRLTGLYDVVDIDPPWPTGMINRHVWRHEVGLKYPVMSLDQIREEVGAKLKRHAAADCHVFLWTTQKFLRDAMSLLDDWAVRYFFPFVWHKPGGYGPFNLPQFNCEFVLYGRTGSPKFIDTKDFPLCFSAPRRDHSEKPEEWYATLRRVTLGRRLAMFSRRAIEGFESWGKEAPDDEASTLAD